jgi:hypothetical protein
MSSLNLCVKLADLINTNMTDFIGEISTKYDINQEELLGMWSSYTGVKNQTKTEKTEKKVNKGPTVKDLKDELRGLGLKVSGRKAELIERLEEYKNNVVSKPIYWENNGKYQKESDMIWKKYVPDSGSCGNDYADQLRLCAKMYYRVYNDGDFGEDAQGARDIMNMKIKDAKCMDTFSDLERILDTIIDEEDYRNGDDEDGYDTSDSDCRSRCDLMSDENRQKLAEDMMNYSIMFAYENLKDTLV